MSDQIIRAHCYDLVAHATDQNVDIVGDNFDVAIRAHSDPLPDSGLVQRTLAPSPWFLFAGDAYIDKHGMPMSSDDLADHPSLFMMRTGSTGHAAIGPGVPRAPRYRIPKVVLM